MPSASIPPAAAPEPSPSTEPADDRGTGDGRRDSRRELAPLAVCVVVGLMMPLLSSIVRGVHSGRFVWIANGDEVFYLAMSSQAYFNHPGYLSDPVFTSGGVALFRQLPLLPGVWLARLLDLGPGGIDNCWRVLGGASLGLAWYLLIRRLVSGRWVAAALTCVLLTDVGLLGSGLFFRQAQAMVHYLAGSLRIPEGLYLHSEWRIATPALTLTYLVLNLYFTIRARERPDALRLALAGLSFGLLFHVYPYYWTAACVALAIAFVLDRGHRKAYFWTGVIGGLIGAPRVVWDFMLKSETGTEWLIRSDKLIRISRLSDLKPPVVACLVLLAAGWWVWTRRRDLAYVWSMAAAGLILFKHHIITGLALENYHWYYVWGPCCSLLLLLLLVAALPREGRRAGIAAGLLIAACAADAAVGFWLRGVETSRIPDAVALTQAWDDYQVQRIDGAPPRLAPNATVAGDSLFIDMSSIIENQRPLDNYWVFLSPYVSDVEWYRRMGRQRDPPGQRPAPCSERFAKDRFAVTEGRKAGWGPWARDPEESARRIRDVMAAYDEVAGDVEGAMDRYGVRYVALAANAPIPGYLGDGGWAPLEEGPRWRVWERRVPSTRSTRPGRAGGQRAPRAGVGAQSG
ncbi:MAG: hypothetical protein U0790_26370 [Isosphaeraceae bacterium]